MTEPKQKVVVLKMVKTKNGIDSDRYPSILEGRCWNRRLGGVLTILDWCKFVVRKNH